MRDLVVALVRGLVTRPERVRVSQSLEEGEVRLLLEVADEDRGRVIGRGGQTVDALRTLLDAVAEQRGELCDLEIVE